MKGIINGIWLTKNGGTLHSNIVPNLSSWLSDAIATDFSVVLWTNINELDPLELEKLKAQNITIKNYSECKQSILHKYFLFFF
jgi:hypothetical protein